MRILFVHEVDWVKKVVFEIHHLSEILSIQGHQVYAIDCRDHDPRYIAEAIRTKVIQNFRRVYETAAITLIRPASISLPLLSRISTKMNFSHILSGVIRTHNIDIIILYSAPTNGSETIRIAKKFGIPVIFRSIDVLHGLVDYPLIKRLVYRAEKKVYRNADRVLAVTTFMAEYAKNMGASEKNISVLPLGVNPETFFPQQKDLTLLNQLHLKTTDKVILFVGTLFHFTGLDKIITGLPDILKKLPDIKLVIVGGGPALKDLQELCIRNSLENHVTFTGFVSYSEVPKFINLSDLCINPFEINHVTDRIIPIKLVEYLSCGKPVVSTPLKGAVELLPDHISGVIYSDKSEFLRNMALILYDTDSSSELGRRGRDYVTSRYSWQSVAAKLVNEIAALK